MKIEMGESIAASWLRHTKECSVVEFSWKYNIKEDAPLDDQIINKYKFFQQDENNHRFTRLKKDIKLKQFIKQGEIDCLGFGLNSSIYAVDVAYHLDGLNYGSKLESTKRVCKKMIRSILSLLTDPVLKDKPKYIYFMTPIISIELYKDIKESFKFIEEQFNSEGVQEVKLLCDTKGDYKSHDENYSREFTNEILSKVIDLSNKVNDTSDLFLRAAQLIKKKYDLVLKNEINHINYDIIEEKYIEDLQKYLMSLLKSLISKAIITTENYQQDIFMLENQLVTRQNQTFAPNKKHIETLLDTDSLIERIKELENINR